MGPPLFLPLPTLLHLTQLFSLPSEVLGSNFWATFAVSKVICHEEGYVLEFDDI